jgi:DNA-directed RNA polymerase subunit RPC12/RpoP
MELLEKVAYIKGLMAGLDLDDEKKEVKVIHALVDLVEDLSATVTDLEEETDEICELIDVLDEDLGDVEEVVFDCEDEDDCDCCHCHDEDDYDGEVYDVTCPTCGKELIVDEEMLDEGEMVCPSCGERLEFDLEIEDCDCDENE